MKKLLTIVAIAMLTVLSANAQGNDKGRLKSYSFIEGSRRVASKHSTNTTNGSM